MKKFLASFFAFAMFVSGTGTVHAEAPSDTTDVSTETLTIQLVDGEERLVDGEGKIHIFFTADQKELSPIDALEKLNSNEYESSNSANSLGGPRRISAGANTVVLSSYWNSYGNRDRVSPYVKGPGKVSITTSITTACTYSFSIGVTSGDLIKKYIRTAFEGQFGIAWQYSSSSSLSLSYDIPAGKTGAIYFTPAIYKTSGYYYDSNYNSYPVSASTPKKLSNGLTDGIFELIYK